MPKPKGPSPSERLQAIYDRLPALECRGLCQAYCGLITMSGLEWRRLTDRLGREPLPVLGQTCAALDPETGRCTAYRHRPLICRLWGAAEGLPCPHGCMPERVLSPEEAMALVAEVELLSAEAGFDNDLPLQRLTETLKEAKWRRSTSRIPAGTLKRTG